MLSNLDQVREAKKDSILKAAAHRILNDGYTKTRIEDIAADLGVTKPFIYYYFDSKTQILEEICRRTTVYSIAVAEAALIANKERDALTRLRSIVGPFVLNVIEERAYLSILFRDARFLSEETRRRFREERRRFHVAFARLLDEGRAGGQFHFADLSVTEQTLTGMMSWPFNWYRSDGSCSPDQVAALVEGLVLSAIGVQVNKVPSSRRKPQPSRSTSRPIKTS